MVQICLMETDQGEEFCRKIPSSRDMCLQQKDTHISEIDLPAVQRELFCGQE